MRIFKFVLAICALLLAPNRGIASTEIVTISYESAGGDEYLERIRSNLMDRGVLEELRAFLSPLRLPTPIVLRATACGSTRLAYDPGTHMVTFCYENAARIALIASEAGDLDDSTKRTLVTGATVEALLHETAYAVFDVLHVPIWGRIEDAADNFAALVMTQFGEDNAAMTIRGTAMFFRLSNRTWTGAGFSSAESPEAQRFYNFLCLAVGADPIAFSGIAENVIPRFRVVQCAEEFGKLRKAFDLRIMPYVDPDLLVKARAQRW